MLLDVCNLIYKAKKHLIFSMELKIKAKRQQQIEEIHSEKLGKLFATLGNGVPMPSSGMNCDDINGDKTLSHIIRS